MDLHRVAGHFVITFLQLSSHLLRRPRCPEAWQTRLCRQGSGRALVGIDRRDLNFDKPPETPNRNAPLGRIERLPGVRDRCSAFELSSGKPMAKTRSVALIRFALSSLQLLPGPRKKGGSAFPDRGSSRFMGVCTFDVGRPQTPWTSEEVNGNYPDYTHFFLFILTFRQSVVSFAVLFISHESSPGCIEFDLISPKFPALSRLLEDASPLAPIEARNVQRCSAF